MKHILFILALILTHTAQAVPNRFEEVIVYDKMSVGKTTSADASAIADFSSTAKGFLIPRMTEAQRDAIATPATGLMIFNTTSGAFNYYTGSAWGLIAGAGGITSLGGLTGATQTFATGTAGTDFAISSVGSTHTFNLPDASASARGLLASSDWSLFNGKLTSTLTNGYIFVGNGSNVATGVAMSGDATISNTGAVTIANDAVSNAKLAEMATMTIKGNNTGGTANPSDLTAANVTAMLDNFVGDSGSGGTKGLVPAPASGDAAANKFLKANGSWEAVPATAAVVTNLTPTASSTLGNTAANREEIAFLNPASAVTLDGTTTFTAASNFGSKLTVCGESDDNTVTIPVSGNVKANGTVVLGEDDCATFVYKDAATDYWLMVSGNF